jgi:hypothetical protein
MKKIYFVTEGKTDQIVIQGLIEEWLGEDDFIVRHIQPPSSAYVEDLETNLSEGWRGVLDWCMGRRNDGAAGRNEALSQADCLIVHLDADVAYDSNFTNPPFSPYPPASPNEQCAWVRNVLTSAFGGVVPQNMVLCVPAQDIEAWVLSSLCPEIVEQNRPIECRIEPGALLVQLPPYRLIRRKGGRLKKQVEKYTDNLPKIVTGWKTYISGNIVHCPSAVRFETEAKDILRL